MRCPHCGAALYRDDDGLACLCGYRKYDLPASTVMTPQQPKPQAKADDNIGWWAVLSTTPDKVKAASTELSIVVIDHCHGKGLTDGEAYAALQIILARLESRLETKLNRAQERNLNGFAHHLVG